MTTRATSPSAVRSEVPVGSRDRPAELEVWRDACRPSNVRGPLRVILRQFGRPVGLFGSLVGAIMARKKDSRRRGDWTLGLLEIEPTDAVLEIGFGPGLALAEACRRAARGRVVGIDHSRLMVRQARRRLRRLGLDGRAELYEMGVETLERLPHLGQFDRILAINSAQFWSHPRVTLAGLCERLRPGGRLALTFQPPWRGAGETDSRRIGEEMTALLQSAGLRTRPYRLLELDAAPAACAIGDMERG